MRFNTYKLMLWRSKSAVSDREMEQVKNILKDISDTDYYMTIEWTPLNNTCHFNTSIIIVKRSFKDAEPVAKKIEILLEESGILVERCNTTLLWDESSQHVLVFCQDLAQIRTGGFSC